MSAWQLFYGQIPNLLIYAVVFRWAGLSLVYSIYLSFMVTGIQWVFASALSFVYLSRWADFWFGHWWWWISFGFLI